MAVRCGYLAYYNFTIINRLLIISARKLEIHAAPGIVALTLLELHALLSSNSVLCFSLHVESPALHITSHFTNLFTLAQSQCVLRIVHCLTLL